MCAISPPSNLAPSFAGSFAFSLSVRRATFATSFGPMCLKVPHLQQHTFLILTQCDSSQINSHRSASFALGPMRVTSPFHKPLTIPLLSMWIKAGPIAFLRKHRKAVNSALLIVSCAPRPVSHTSFFFRQQECKGVSIQCVNKRGPAFTQCEKWAKLAQPRVAKIRQQVRQEWHTVNTSTGSLLEK